MIFDGYILSVKYVSNVLIEQWAARSTRQKEVVDRKIKRPIHLHDMTIRMENVYSQNKKADFQN